MGTWFDSLAKRAARGEIEESGLGSSGLTRRQVLVGGAAVTGAMWTAPVLMSAASAQAAVSPLNCPAGTTESFCPQPNTTGTVSLCCPAGEGCGFTSAGVVGCVPDNTVGGQCKNNGVGQCGGNEPGTRARCNGVQTKPQPTICGGNTAPCNGNQGEVCGPGFVCTPDPNPQAAGDGTCQPAPAPA